MLTAEPTGRSPETYKSGEMARPEMEGIGFASGNKARYHEGMFILINIAVF